jgi:hypothetical protein
MEVLIMKNMKSRVMTLGNRLTERMESVGKPIFFNPLFHVNKWDRL